MTSRRSWILSLALGAAISVNYASTSFAQAPRNISYQGQLMENNQPATGQYTITINYYNAGGSAPIHTETFTNAQVQNGIFNLILGSSSPFPSTMDFTEQYFIGVQVNGGTEMQPRTPMLSVPYALNANTLNGFSVGDVPSAGQILVLDNNGRVPQSALPAGPSFVAGNNIVIQQDTTTNTYTFSSIGGGSGTGITSIVAGNGLFGGGSTGDVTIGIAPNSITSDMISAGSITGNKLSPVLAGDGLYQDILGNLNVGVDNSSIVISNDQLSIGMLGSVNLDSTVQRTITGAAAPGSFITGVNNNGTVNTGTLTSDNSLTRTLTGNNVQFGINPANSNTFTAAQNFGTINAQTVNTVDLNATGNVNLGGATSNINFTTTSGAINLGGNRLQNVGIPTAGTDAVTVDYLNGQMNGQVFGGDVTGNFGNLQLNPNNPGLGDRLIQGINTGTNGQIINDVINDDLTINGGTIDNTIIGGTTPSSATFTDATVNGTLTVNGNAVFGNGTAANTFVFNTNGGSISLSGTTLQGVGNPVLGTDAVNLTTLNDSIAANNAAQTLGGDISGPNGTNELNLTNPGIGDRLISGVNSGTTTVNDPAIADNLTINGGTIDNTPIGATTASTGNFTTLNSSAQTMLATGSGDVVIGTANPLNTGAILEIERAQNTELLARIYNTGAAGSELRLIGGSSATSTLSFTDATDYLGSVNVSSGGGMTLNVRNTTETNSDATLEGAVALRIERDRDVVIEEDLTVNGAVNFGNGADNITFNSGTGTVDFSGARITNVGDPVADMDAVNLQTLNNAITTNNAAQTLGGDISGANGNNTLNLTNPGIGDRLVSGINSGTTTVNDAAIADALTLNGGTIDNTPIGATGASSGMFTTLSSTEQTQLATSMGNVVIGTNAPLENDAIIQVQRAQGGDLLQRIYNTGAGGSELRLAGANGVNNTLSFTDADEWLASINGNDQVGMTFNVRNTNETNSEATLDASTAMTIERDRDVVINEDLAVGGTLTVTGPAMFEGGLTFGNGADNITFNSGTGTIDFGGATLTNVGDPVNPMDAVNLQTLNNSAAAQTFAGDIMGTPSTITLDPTNAGIGDRLITGINNGTTTINDANLADALTVNGGTIDNTPIGATTASSGNFTTLNSTGQTQVATASGNLVVGTATPSENDAIIQVQRAQGTDLLQRIYNTGSGGAELRLAGASGVTNTLGFTDDNEWLASVNANDAVGMTLNVRDVAETNSEASLDASVAVTIERDRDVVINEDLAVGGTLTVGNGTFTGSTFGISGGDVTSTATPSGTTSNRFADTYTVSGGPLGTVTINNSLVTPNSTVIVTFEDNSGGTIPTYTVQTDATGSFDVVFNGANAEDGDEIHYMIINH